MNYSVYSTCMYKHQQIEHQLNLFHLNHIEASLNNKSPNSIVIILIQTNKILLKHILKKETEISGADLEVSRIN